MKQPVPIAETSIVRPQLIVVVLAVCALVAGIVWPSLRQAPQPMPDAGRFDRLHGQHGAKLPFRAPPPPADCAVQACLALTFDDGPSATVTPEILNVLHKHHARATFFVVGSHVPGNEELLRRMYRDGHEIGNHSWSHPDLTTQTISQMEMQVERTQAVVSAAGVPAPTLFRPPYGAVNAVVQAHIPLTFAMWNVDPEDWEQKTPRDVIAHVEANVRPGRVVDLHDIHQPTADALDQLLTDLAPQYQFVTFSQLFNIGPGQRGLYYGR